MPASVGARGVWSGPGRRSGPRARLRLRPDLWDPQSHDRSAATLWHVVPRCGTLRYSETVADHYTLRLAPGIRQRLADWARRSGMPERSLAQRYVDEGLRHDAHPLIQFLDGPSGRRASLAGRGLDVWEVIATIRDNNGSIAQAADYLD